RALREARGLRQRELAELVGTTQSASARLKGGSVSPSLPTLDKIADALDAERSVSRVDLTAGSGPVASGRSRSRISQREASALSGDGHAYCSADPAGEPRPVRHVHRSVLGLEVLDIAMTDGDDGRTARCAGY